MAGAAVNKVILVGRLGVDPEIKTVTSGQTITQFRVATSETWNDRDGQRQERTEWHRVVVWGKLAEVCGRYLQKGRQVYIEGRIQTRSWDDPQGQKKYMTEIVANVVQFLGGPNERDQANVSMGSMSNSMPAASASFGANGSGGLGSTGGPGQMPDFGPEPSFGPSEEMPF